jgi:hypothetical protein
MKGGTSEKNKVQKNKEWEIKLRKKNGNKITDHGSCISQDVTTTRLVNICDPYGRIV